MQHASVVFCKSLGGGALKEAMKVKFSASVHPMKVTLHVTIVPVTEEIKVVATNRKAGFEYFLIEKFEAGLSLQGSEIKSIRAGQMSLVESYIEIESGQAWLRGAHIAPYEQANRYNHDPLRARRLLLNKREIRQLFNSVRQKGMTIVPTRVYLKEGRAKIEIALARGKKLHDKRQEIAKRDSQRDSERESRVR
jgi:SsrA-binding protein